MVLHSLLWLLIHWVLKAKSVGWVMRFPRYVHQLSSSFYYVFLFFLYEHDWKRLEKSPYWHLWFICQVVQAGRLFLVIIYLLLSAIQIWPLLLPTCNCWAGRWRQALHLHDGFYWSQVCLLWFTRLFHPHWWPLIVKFLQLKVLTLSFILRVFLIFPP